MKCVKIPKFQILTALLFLLSKQLDFFWTCCCKTLQEKRIVNSFKRHYAFTVSIVLNLPGYNTILFCLLRYLPLLTDKVPGGHGIQCSDITIGHSHHHHHQIFGCHAVFIFNTSKHLRWKHHHVSLYNNHHLSSFLKLLSWGNDVNNVYVLNCYRL